MIRRRAGKGDRASTILFRKWVIHRTHKSTDSTGSTFTSIARAKSRMICNKIGDKEAVAHQSFAHGPHTDARFLITTRHHVKEPHAVQHRYHGSSAWFSTALASSESDTIGASVPRFFAQLYGPQLSVSSYCRICLQSDIRQTGSALGG